MFTYQCNEKIKIHENLSKCFQKTSKVIDLFSANGELKISNFIPELKMDCWIMKLTSKINLVTYEDPSKIPVILYINQKSNSDISNKSIEEALIFHSKHSGPLIIFVDSPTVEYPTVESST